MRRALLVLLLLILPMPFQAQDPAPPSGHYENEPDAYCLAGPPMPNDTNGHECHCQLMCSQSQPGAPVIRNEDPKCVTYCNSSKCRCHPDEFCELPDMEPEK